jgi:hypothetical protein
MSCRALCTPSPIHAERVTGQLSGPPSRCLVKQGGVTVPSNPLPSGSGCLTCVRPVVSALTSVGWHLPPFAAAPEGSAAPCYQSVNGTVSRT